jgi:hypothetical protein
LGVWYSMTIDYTEMKKMIYQHKDQFITGLKNVFSYRFAQEIDTILFEIHGGFNGLFNISITPMVEGEEFGYEKIRDLLRKVNFEVNLQPILDSDDDDTYKEKNRKLNEIAPDMIFQFFVDCYEEANGNQIPYHCYLRHHEADDVFDLKNKSWLIIDDLYE